MYNVYCTMYNTSTATQYTVITLLYSNHTTIYSTVISNHTTTHQTLYIVSVGKTAHFLLNFTRNKIKLAQIMNNQVYSVRNTCYFDVQ